MNNMPYELRGNCVHKKEDDKPLKCYDNHADAVAYLRALEMAMEKEGGKSANTEELVVFGAEIKALGEGKIGGVLIRRTDANSPDLTGDFFSKDSDIRCPGELDVYYNHGLDSTLKKRVIGRAKISQQENGDLWAETQLAMRDEYEKAIYMMAESGKLGYSSGAISHLVEREPAGKGIWIIKTWAVGELSLTPTPAEYRNTVHTLKSLFPPDAALPDADVNQKYTEIKTMDENEIKAIAEKAAADALAKRDAEEKAEAEKRAALKAAEDEGYKKALEDWKNRKAPAFNTEKLGFSEEKDAVPAFKAWLQTGQVNDGLIRPPSDLLNIKAAFNISDGATGGYLVPDPMLDRIIAKRDLASWVRKAPCQYFTTDGDHLIVPIEATSHTAFVLTAEAAAYDNNEGTVDQVDLALLKYTKEVRVTEEFLAGKNSNFEAWLTNALARAVAVTENTVATTAILHGATAATAAASATAITAAELARTIGSLSKGYNVDGETGFLMKNSTKWYCMGLATGSGPFAFYNTPGTPGIFGQPVYVSDDMAAMTTTLKSVLFANFQYFAVLERPGMLVQRNPYLYMANGKIGIFANIYRAFDNLQTEAVYTMAQA